MGHKFAKSCQGRNDVFIALVGRSAIPLGRLGVVLLHALALFIHEAQVELRISIALLGRSAIPLGRLGVVLLHALAILIHDTQVALRLRIAHIPGRPLCDTT